MGTEWLKLPDIDGLSYRGVLAQYGQTMEYVQRFEYTLKCLHVLSKLHIQSAKAPLSEPEFDRILSDNGMLGPTLERLKKLFDEIGLEPYPAKMEAGLEKLRVIRNSLAHSYLVDNSRVLADPDAQKDLISELRFFGEAFSAMTRSWERFLTIAFEKLGEGAREEVESQLGPVFDQAQREHLRQRIAGYGL